MRLFLLRWRLARRLKSSSRRASLLHSAGLNSLAPWNRHGMRQYGAKLGWCPHRNSPGRTIHSPRARYRYDPHATAVERADTRLGLAPSSPPLTRTYPRGDINTQNYLRTQKCPGTSVKYRGLSCSFLRAVSCVQPRTRCLRPGAFRGEPLRRSGRRPRDGATPGPWPPSWRGLPHPGRP